ncbi:MULTISPECIES: hypothetical protein [unclassified Streptomyces]|uniref:hypothetical protein n=1 Tax=unclassified Streptomyces TaxID=2593676 RepID=UPI0033F8CFD2
MTADPLLERALVEEATKKSGLIWVQGENSPARALWHVWHEGAVYVVGDGPGEQPLPGLVDGGSAEVTVRSKDKGGRLVAWTARVSELAPGSQEWEAGVAELKPKRLNAVNLRWAEQCRVVRLTPRDVATSLPSESLAAAPLPTGATTREPLPGGLPRLLFRRKRR